MTLSHHFMLNSSVNFLVGNTPIRLEDYANFEAYYEAFKAVGEKQIKLIRDEFEELRDRGFEARNVKEVRDGLGDVIVTLDGLLYRLNIPYTNVFAPALPVLDAHVRNGIERSGISPFHFQHRLRVISGALGDLLGRVVNFQSGNLHAFRQRCAEPAELIYLQVYALAYELGVDLADDQEEIFYSNMSKFDTDLETAEKGLVKYSNMGVAAALFPKEVEGITYHVIKSTEDRVIGGRPFPAGKFLKSVNFKEPNLSPLRNGALLGKLFITAEELA